MITNYTYKGHNVVHLHKFIYFIEMPFEFDPSWDLNCRWPWIQEPLRNPDLTLKWYQEPPLTTNRLQCILLLCHSLYLEKPMCNGVIKLWTPSFFLFGWPSFVQQPKIRSSPTNITLSLRLVMRRSEKCTFKFFLGIIF